MFNRRELLRLAGGAAAMLSVSDFPLGWAAADSDKKKKLLMFTRSQNYEHSVVKREKGELSLAERVVSELGKKHDFEVTCSKDGREFLPENIAKYDAFLFETTGDLTKEGGTDNNPAMPPEGKKALLDAIAAGKGFIGCHCASDTFHSEGKANENQDRDKLDPYIAMLGGEFITHGAQQDAKMKVVDASFPGAKDLKDFEIKEEWYALKNFAPDLHVILVQSTEGMKGDMYERPDFPATWARMQDKGRVFYTSMGHREDVWESDTMKNLLAGAISWVFKNVDADVKPNIDKVTPKAAQLRKD